MGFETPTPPEVETQKPIIDMAPILERVRPIDGVFSPSEEIQKLWDVPEEQRREAVASFKDKLARQREAWALCRTSIEGQIDSNPDLPREEMVGVIGAFASHYGFSPDQVKVAESLVNDYMEMHKRVNEVRKKYPDNIALINRLTDMKFSESDAEDFEIVVGPMSIEITCSGFNCGRICEISKDPVVFIYRGFASSSSDAKPYYYLVINRDIGAIQIQYTRDHEVEHQKNVLLRPKLYGTSEVRGDVREQLNRGVRGFLRHQIGERVLRFGRDFESEVFQQYESTQDPEKKDFLLAEYMRLKRESALNDAKDEIIALFKVDVPHTVQLGYSRYGGDLNYLFLGRKGDAYDYLHDLRERDDKKGDLLWQETAQRVLVDEYGFIIKAATDSFDQLVKSGYSESEVIAMLSDKRLAEWPKTVRRLLKQKEERQ